MKYGFQEGLTRAQRDERDRVAEGRVPPTSDGASAVAGRTQVCQLHTGGLVVADRLREVQIHEASPRGRPDLIVIVPQAPQPDGERTLRSRFRLTRQEAKVARLLEHRLSDREIATALGVALDTARNHVRAVRQKLYVASRRDVPGVLASVAGWTGTKVIDLN